MIRQLTLLLLLILSVKFSYPQTSWHYIGTLPSSSDITSISVVDSNVIFVASKGNNLFRTINGGSTWQLKNSGLAASGDLYGISAVDSLNCWVGWLNSSGTPASIYRTTNGGTSWTLQWSLTGSFPDGIKMFTANYGIAIGDPTGNGHPYQFRFTTDGGTSWNLSPTSPIAFNEFGVINSFDFIDTNIIWVASANTIASSTTCKIYRTTDGINGTWMNTVVNGVGGSSGLYYQAIGFVDKNNGLAGSQSGNLIKTTDAGATWIPINSPGTLTSFGVINMFAFKDGSNIIRMSVVDAQGGHCFNTTDLGTTWAEEILPPEGSTSGIQHMQFVNGSLGFAGGAAGILLKFSNPITAVQKETTPPANYSLSQNFPNPFNPSTIIKYQIPNNSYLTLKVYNSLGQEVATLVNGMINAGTHEVQFKGSNLSSGVYYYVIKAGDNFVQSKKMILMK